MKNGIILLLLVVALLGQIALRRQQTAQTPALAEGAFVALGGLRSIAAEVIWFRADRLQDEGRYVELAQLASALTAMEPHTPEVWSYAAWNLAYNISIMMATPEDRWRWVEAAIRLLRDEGLRLNPESPDLCRDLAWLFELKLGVDIDSASSTYRRIWREKVEDIAARDAWAELGMDRAKMREIETRMGLGDWTDPCLSAIYWALEGLPRAKGREASMLKEIIRQSNVIYQKRHYSAADAANRASLAIAYNYCTLSYTMAYWDKAEWSVELDRLAAAGYNAALLTKGLDKVWALTLEEMGYDEATIRSFIASDAYQAWWHMGNLEGAGGPVPSEEIEHNAELGRWLYAEMKRRGIEPMVQAFVGMVPHNSPENFPVFDQGYWCQIYRRPSILDPRSPEFARFSEVWYKILRKVYDMDHAGAARFLVGDLFHEGGQAGKLTDAELARVGSAIQETQKRHFGNKVTWVLQAWQLNSAQKALMSGLSARNTLIEHLDKHMGSSAPLAFNLVNNRGEALPWVWAEVSNFGGNTGMRGAVSRFRSLDRVAPESRAAFRGYAMLSEGLETNDALYRLFEAKMRGKTYDFAGYPRELVDLLVKSAWTQHTRTVTEGCVENILCAWPRFDLTCDSVTTWGTRTGTEYAPERLREAARISLKYPDLPREFMVELFMQLLADRAREIIAECETSKERRAEFLKLIDYADRIASCAEVYRLDWQEARRHGHASAYRTLITSWTGDLDSAWESGLHDYAHRAYSGLLRHYYLRRWQWFFDYHDGKITADEFVENCRELDRTFPTETLPPPQAEDIISLAREILDVVE